MKVAILGANGQVGAEVCLLLRNHPGITIVPVCRNRLGSAFLRYAGFACRHGMPADSAQAPGLIQDCNLVVNLALGSGTLREASDANRRLIRNAVEFSAPGATIMHCSTQSVYGNPYPGKRLRWKNNYAREKLRCEKYAMKMGRKFGKKMIVVRLGHVCGELQGITAMIRREIAAGPVHVPAPGRKSNTVYIATIVDAILKASGDNLVAPGIYDLVNEPQWTWREVYEHEARVTGKRLVFDERSIVQPVTRPPLLKRMVSSLGRLLLSNPVRKEYAMQLIALLSTRLNKRIQSYYYRNRAAAEIAALGKHEIRNDALKWREVGWSFIGSLDRTADLVSQDAYQVRECAADRRWPEDLAPASA
jgi:nucleoside-diphosphate-sugar epimerase